MPAGSTILDAAERLGIEIPTLCFSRQCEPSTSCLVCLVKLLPSGRMVPACATPVTEDMQVESETDEIHAVRRSTLELLLSDHLGDCVAPCSFGCPAQMNIPQMLRQIAAGELREALVTVKADIAMPAVLGRICPAPCEKVCRRGNLDGAIAICELKRIVADVDLASAAPYLPPCRPASGKRVAIVGGGPAGLAAAYYLAQGGHACTIFDDTDTLGGMFGREIPAEKLPRERSAARDRPDPPPGHGNAAEHADRPRRFAGGTSSRSRGRGDRRRLDRRRAGAALGRRRFRRRDCRQTPHLRDELAGGLRGGERLARTGNDRHSQRGRRQGGRSGHRTISLRAGGYRNEPAVHHADREDGPRRVGAAFHGYGAGPAPPMP